MSNTPSRDTAQRSVEDRLARVEAALVQGDNRMAALEQGQADIKRELQQNTEVTTDVRDLFSAFRGGFRVLGWLGNAAKWLGWVAGGVSGVVALYYLLKNGGKP